MSRRHLFRQRSHEELGSRPGPVSGAAKGGIGAAAAAFSKGIHKLQKSKSWCVQSAAWLRQRCTFAGT
eukprot:6012543-Pleurochrysis_carterae.AAC.1